MRGAGREEILDAQMRMAVAEKKRIEHDEILSKLDELRRTRKARGGVGAPLQVPFHLRDAAGGYGIVVTDADLNPDIVKTREEMDDADADLANALNEIEKADS